jgi:hypothetical protein
MNDDHADRLRAEADAFAPASDPGLIERILAARQAPEPAPLVGHFRRVRWVAGLAAMLVAAIALPLFLKDRRAPTGHIAIALPAADLRRAADSFSTDPLASEAAHLREDLERAGRFIVGRLPGGIAD